MRNQLLTLSVAVLFSACAGNPGHDGDPTMAAADQVICKREYPTGSHLPKRVCRTRAQIEEDERNARLLEDRMNDRVPHREREAGGN